MFSSLRKGLFQSFKLDAVVGEVRDYPGVLLPVLGEHPLKVALPCGCPAVFLISR